MAAGDVGRDVLYEYEAQKFVPGQIIEYAAGKDQGDHRIGGFTNSDQKEAGAGDVFNVWSVEGTGAGTFRLA